jgi:hypothetical protein
VTHSDGLVCVLQLAKLVLLGTVDKAQFFSVFNESAKDSVTFVQIKRFFRITYYLFLLMLILKDN